MANQCWKKNELVLWALNDLDGNMEDFEVLKQFIDYTSALTEANNTDARKGEQISIWETDEETLDVLNSWIIKEHYE